MIEGLSQGLTALLAAMTLKGSLLIAALLLLRRALGIRASPRLLYALWLPAAFVLLGVPLWGHRTMLTMPMWLLMGLLFASQNMAMVGAVRTKTLEMAVPNRTRDVLTAQAPSSAN